MNDIRINKEEEKDIIKVKFKLPLVILIIFIICLILGLTLFIISIYMLSNLIGSANEVAAFFVIGLLLLSNSAILFPLILAIRKCSCTITNKRIYGVTNVFISKKNYSYRLDEIENVETVSSFGIHGLSLNFTQGHGPQGPVRYNRGVSTISGAGTFRISHISNISEVYEKLTELLTSVKNEKDLMVDIEMSKIEVENRKADAFENMANNLSGSKVVANTNLDYISELKGLKELLDAGIITKEEFDEKKAKLMK